MKLRSKKIAHLEAESRKKAQIDEGVRIAGKVDALRETLTTESTNLEKFRLESVSIIQNEILVLSDQKEDLLREVESLEERKRLALVPLTQELQKIKDLKQEITDEREKLVLDKEGLRQDEILLVEERNDIEIQMARADDALIDAKKQKSTAASLLKDAREESADMRNEAQKALSKAELKERELDEREKVISVSLEDLIDREMKIRDWEKDLTDREILLKDRYETLERTINRLDHGRS